MDKYKLLPGQQLTFEQDNSRKHTAKGIVECFTTRNVLKMTSQISSLKPDPIAFFFFFLHYIKIETLKSNISKHTAKEAYQFLSKPIFRIFSSLPCYLCCPFPLLPPATIRRQRIDCREFSVFTQPASLIHHSGHSAYSPSGPGRTNISPSCAEIQEVGKVQQFTTSSEKDKLLGVCSNPQRQTSADTNYRPHVCSEDIISPGENTHSLCNAYLIKTYSFDGADLIIYFMFTAQIITVVLTASVFRTNTFCF